jgi:hypothetical protein
VRGIRRIERQAEKAAESDPDDEESDIVRGYCAAVRAALTDDGLPPLAAAGLKLQDRLSRIAASLRSPDLRDFDVGPNLGSRPRRRSSRRVSTRCPDR